MKYLLPIFLFIPVAAMAQTVPATPPVKAETIFPTAKAFAPVDWPVFMAGNDMKWSTLPKHWQEAPHFGNAMLGTMLYQNGGDIRLQLFRADVQDHRDDSHGWVAYSRPRLGVGSLNLKPVGKLTSCTWRKDLWDAELTGTITTDKGALVIRHFVHAQDMVIVTEITPQGEETGAQWSWSPVAAKTTRSGYPTKPEEIPGFARQYGPQYTAETLKLNEPNPTGRQETKDGVELWRQDLLAGGGTVTAWKELRDASGKRTLLTTVEHSYPDNTAAEKALASLRKASTTPADARDKSHREWWHDYYRRSYVRIPDAALERLYWQTIYRYGCTSRLGRSYVDCPGIWFQGGNWNYTTTDWNIQAAHWAVCTANRLDQGLELFERFHSRREELVKAVRPVEWQKDSAYLPIEVAGDMIGHREQDMRWANMTGNLPWALNNAWSFYRYSMDDAMLREKLFPLLRRSINFYLHMLTEGPDGKLHLPPTISPESGTHKDCNFDLALLKWGCHTLLNSCRRLKIDDPLIPRWEEVLKRTADFPSDQNGYMLGSNKTSSTEHRHGSHLLMLYPLHLVNIDQPATLDLAKKSYLRFDAIPGLPAMVQAHAGPIGASLGMGDAVLSGLLRQAANLHPNGMWYTPPCLESSLTVANTIQDMLLQSWCDPADRTQTGLIRVFPALPGEWKDVEFHDLCTEGAFLVSAKRSAGRTTQVLVKSLAGEPCRIRTDMGDKLRTTPAVPLRTLGNGVVELGLKKGESVLLTPM